jgi:hypothetical protein
MAEQASDLFSSIRFANNNGTIVSTDQYMLAVGQHPE